MAVEILEDAKEILEFEIPPPIGDEHIPFGYRVFDVAAIGVNLLFIFLWAAICFTIWIAIGTPFFILLWLVANLFDILSRPFRKN